MLDRLSKRKRNIGLLVVLALVGWFLWTVRAVLNPLILGYLLAFVLHPAVLHLERRRGWSRPRAVNVIFLTAALFITTTFGGIWFQGKQLVEAVSAVSAEDDVLKRAEERIDAFIAKTRAWSDRLTGADDKDEEKEGEPEGEPEGQPVSEGDAPVVPPTDPGAGVTVDPGAGVTVDLGAGDTAPSDPRPGGATSEVVPKVDGTDTGEATQAPPEADPTPEGAPAPDPSEGSEGAPGAASGAEPDGESVSPDDTTSGEATDTAVSAGTAANTDGSTSTADGSQTPADDTAAGSAAAGNGKAPNGERNGREGAEEVTLRDLVRAWWKNYIARTEGGAGAVALHNAPAVLVVLVNFFGSIVSLAGLVLLLPIYGYFLLFELERIHRFVRRHVPKDERDRVTRIGTQIGEVIANFFRGRLLICVLKGGVITIGLALVGGPYPMFFGVMAGMLSLVPFVGPLLTFVVAMVFGLQDLSLVAALLRIGGVFLLGEFLEGYVFIPKILGDSLGLHPVVVLVSIFAGGASLGMFGFLIAIPLMAALVILAREMLLPALRQFADEDSHVDGPGAGPPAGPLAGGTPTTWQGGAPG